VFGLPKNAFFLCMAVVGSNVDRQRGYRSKHKLATPWPEDFAPDDVTQPRTTRSKRRTNTYSDLLRSHGPP